MLQIFITVQFMKINLKKLQVQMNFMNKINHQEQIVFKERIQQEKNKLA